MILRFLFFAFLCYILYKLVFNFILPIYRTTKKVKKHFREMQEKAQQQAGDASGYQPSGTVNKNKKESLGDYIDFEEVKD